MSFGHRWTLLILDVLDLTLLQRGDIVAFVACSGLSRSSTYRVFEVVCEKVFDRTFALQSYPDS